jgi:protein O-GlcNAc transferase
MAAAWPPTALAARPAPGERVRVGIVCGHIRDHSVWRLPTRGWVEGLDRARFELIGYHTSGLCDPETARARTRFDRFVQGPLPTAIWRERIAADRPHALIYPEIGMDPVVAQLAALRLAPVQYASWGHPSTSGYPTIDFFLSSDAMEPPGAEAHYSERLVRLPGFSTPISIPSATPPPSRAALGLPDAAPVFWCAQTLSKYLPGDDRLFPAIAAQAPGCQFVFIEHPDGPALTERFRQRLAAAFAAEGLDAERHCVFLPRLAPEAFRAAIGCADVVLDSVGWSGCNSLIDALPHALPIVTLPGATMRARHGLALLDQLGLAHLACPDAAAYVETAVRLANNPEARAAIGAAIRAALPGLADPAPIAALERHILEACAAAPLR